MKAAIYILQLAILLTLMSSCMKRPEEAAYTSESQYALEVAQAQKEIKDASGVNLDLSGLVTITENAPGFYAVCKNTTSNKFGKKVIAFSSSYKLLKHDGKVAVILHELGHCYFGLHHSDEGVQLTKPDLMVHQFSDYMLEDIFATESRRAPYVYEMVRRGS